MKAIIVGGGLSTRLLPLTKNLPKTLLRVEGRPILDWQLEALKKGGVKEVIFISGYKGQKVKALHPELKYIDDLEYRTKISILRGLLCAEKEMKNGFIFSYADIIYTKKIVRKLVRARGYFNLVVDVDWRKGYVGRKKHPITEAELVKTNKDKVIKIGKDVVCLKESHGEFIGLAKFSKKGAEILISEYHRLLQEYENKQNQRFQNAKEFHNAYLTDMIQELIDREHEIYSVNIKGGWTEIDTDEDIERANIFWSKKHKER